MGVCERRGRGLRAIPVLLVALLVGLLVAACGGTSSVLSAVGNSIGGDAAAPLPAATQAPRGSASGGSSGQQSNGNGNPPAQLRDDLKIVYTGSLELVVADLQPALAKAKAAVLAAGGYIGASQESNDGDKSVATITYRIPASRWEDTIDALRGVGTKTVAEQTQATEIGGQLVDLDARIRNLQASETALVQIAQGAGKISDLLEVQSQLTDIRGQIEQLKGQQAQLNDQVAYGTLVTTFGLQVVRVQEAAKGWDPSKDVDGATATLVSAGQTIVSAAIWFVIVWVPLILVLLVLLLIARFVLRRVVPSSPPAGPVEGWGGGS